MDLKAEIKRNTLFNLIRYNNHLINQLNEFHKIVFDENVKMIIFQASCNYNTGRFNILCDIINHEDKKMKISLMEKK